MTKQRAGMLTRVNIFSYFRSSANIEADKKASSLIMQRTYIEFRGVFTGIGCFEGTIKLRVKEGSHLYQAPSRRVACALQQPFNEELD